ncbi:hypothetical protein B0A55_03246 [Friedmanniomyces simplex]|uniref:Uncharacterized protein n=1 Tax=Friedmanniomyces simplex TaxID=329884 RepID=A0A4U0XGH5_9PEZI|nr:hypothetical protein B0A55_03246 [Friedmanniomyces simplex]
MLEATLGLEVVGTRHVELDPYELIELTELVVTGTLWLDVVGAVEVEPIEPAELVLLVLTKTVSLDVVGRVEVELSELAELEIVVKLPELVVTAGGNGTDDVEFM